MKGHSTRRLGKTAKKGQRPVAPRRWAGADRCASMTSCGGGEGEWEGEGSEGSASDRESFVDDVDRASSEAWSSSMMAGTQSHKDRHKLDRWVPDWVDSDRPLRPLRDDWDMSLQAAVQNVTKKEAMSSGNQKCDREAISAGRTPTDAGIASSHEVLFDALSLFENLYSGYTHIPRNSEHNNNNVPLLRGGPDVTSHLLSFLVPYDIRSVALSSSTCRDMTLEDTLWRIKFTDRWNVGEGLVGMGWEMNLQKDCNDMAATFGSSYETDDAGDESSGDGGGSFGRNEEVFDLGACLIWRRAYISAHLNVHDLWITHWNCVYPEDSTSAGRCCVPDARVVWNGGATDRKVDEAAGMSDDDDGRSFASMHMCPTCRHHPLRLGESSLPEMSAAIRNETAYSASTSSPDFCSDTVGEAKAPSVHETSCGMREDPVLRTERVARTHGLLLQQDYSPEGRRQHSGRVGLSRTSPLGPTTSLGLQNLVVEDCSTSSNVTGTSNAVKDWDDNFYEGLADLSTTPARAIHAAALHTTAKWARNLGTAEGLNLCSGSAASSSVNVGFLVDNEKLNCQKRSLGRETFGITARRRRERSSSAFSNAATFRRSINPDQYRSSGLSFLTDTLFFNVRPTWEKALSEGWDSNGTEKNQRNEAEGWTWADELDGALRDVYGESAIDVRCRVRPPPSVPSAVAAKVINKDEHLPPLDPSNPSSLVRVPGGPVHETSLHTWHVVRLTNPDFVRPLTYRAYVQRPDCFVVYPAEGYLRPGETVYLTLGVRTLGSLICEAFEELEVRREDADELLSEVHGIESHLPYAPFAIRYMYASAMPCVPPGFSPQTRMPPSATFTARGGVHDRHDRGAEGGDRAGRRYLHRPSLNNGAGSLLGNDVAGTLDGDAYSDGGERDVLGYLWDAVANETDVRTIYLSAHVHANYSFDQFCDTAEVPFEVRAPLSSASNSATAPCCPPLTFVSPNLHRRDPGFLAKMNNLELETSQFETGRLYRTEKCCSVCGKDWGARSEELGRAYLLRRLVVDGYDRKRSDSMDHFVRLLRLLGQSMKSVDNPDGLGGCLKGIRRLHHFVFCLYNVILRLRADRTLSLTQKALLEMYTVFLNKLCVNLQESVIDLASSFDSQVTHLSFHLGEHWRYAGAHHDSELNGLLQHGPGIFCLGEQDDPNHTGERGMELSKTEIALGLKADNRKLISLKEATFSRRNILWEWNHADVYRDDARMAFVSALAMLSDPRSLLVNGIYDRIDGPGAVIRRQTMPDLLFTIPDDFVQVKAAKQSTEQTMLVRNKPNPIGSAGPVHYAQHEPTAGLTSIRSTGVFSLGEKAILGWKAAGLELNDPDPDTLSVLQYNSHQQKNARTKSNSVAIVHHASMMHHLQNVPPPAVGRFLLSVGQRSRASDMIRGSQLSRVFPLWVHTGDSLRQLVTPFHRSVAISSNTQLDARQELQQLFQPVHPPNHMRIDGAADDLEEVGGPHAINLLWLISARFGWYVDDDRHPGAVLVNRGILIATQWLANTLMATPLLITLVARSMSLISPAPLDYHLDGLPYDMQRRMRYLDSKECGYAAIVLILFWLVLGRYSERNISRSFERTMQEQITRDKCRTGGIIGKLIRLLSCLCQQLWDRICPLFLQRLIFVPTWNRRSQSDIMKLITHSRSQDLREHRSTFHADAGRGRGALSSCKTSSGRPRSSRTSKSTLCLGFLVALWSFSTCSPHFALNALTVFCGSIALGLSMSLQYMEIGRGTQAIGPRALFRPMRLNVVAVASLLAGQLVGSSGGILFLAEFVVTSTSLILGGAATISTNAVESWICFFFLSAAAFCGYLFARVGLVDGIRHKRAGWPSICLCVSLMATVGLWFHVLLFWDWEVPASVMVVNSARKQGGNNTGEALDQLQ